MINVAGAGIVGLSVAWALTRRGESVRVFDRGEPGGATSFGNSGSLSAGSVVPLATPGAATSGLKMVLDSDGPLVVRRSYLLRALPWLVRFARVSDAGTVRGIAAALLDILSPTLPAWRAQLEQTGSLDLYEETGQLHVYASRQALDADGFGWRLRTECGVRTDRLDREGLLSLQPGIGPAYTHGVFVPDAATITDPHGLCLRIASVLRAAGVEFVVAPVDSVGADGSVRAAGRNWPGRACVVAAGAWSAPLLGALGIRVPLESQRGYHVQRAENLVAAGVELKRPVVAADAKVFIVPMGAGTRVGGTVEFAGLVAGEAPRRYELLRRAFARVFPQAPAPAAAERTWMGHRPCLPDSLPVLGPVPGTSGLWTAFGHGHLGLTMSAVTGAWIAEALQGRPVPALERFSIDRPTLRARIASPPTVDAR